MWVAEEKIKLLKDCGLHENTYRSTCVKGESICLTAIVKQIMLTYYKWAEKSKEFRMDDDEFLVWDSCQKCLIEKNGILKKQMSFGIKLYQSISLNFELEVDLFRGNNDISIYLSPKEKSPLSCNPSTVRYVASNLLGVAKGMVIKTDYTKQVLQAMQRHGKLEWSEECNQEGQLPKVILKTFPGPGTQDESAALEKEKITGAEHVENTNCIDALMSIVVEIIKQKVYIMSKGTFSYKYLAFKVQCGTSADTVTRDQEPDTTYFKRESTSLTTSGEALDGGGLGVDYKQVVTIKIDVINHKRFETNKEGNPLSSLATRFVADEVLLNNMELKFHFTNAEIYLEFVPGEIAPTLDKLYQVYKLGNTSSYYSGLSHYVAYMAGFERYQKGESSEEKFIMKFDAAWAKKSGFDTSWVKTIAMYLLKSNAQGYFPALASA